MEIDYIPYEDEKGRITEIALYIEDYKVMLNKAHVFYIWEMLGRVINDMTLIKTEDKPRPSKIVETLYRRIPTD